MENTQTKKTATLKSARLIPITKLLPNTGQIDGLPQNPRFIRDTQFDRLKKSIQDAPEMMEMRSLIVVEYGKSFVTICGNMRLRACQDLGYKELPCYVLAATTPAEKLREYTIKDNVGFGQSDWDILANEWDTAELEDWGMDLGDWGLSDDNNDDEKQDDGNYSRKIEVPTYEPSDKKPDISELTDTHKRDELVKAINKTKGLTDEEREFLLQSAQRHVVFNYKKIGDFYAHSDKTVQELMEQSALVIIDFDNAISGGFVELAKELLDLRKQEDDED